jgi:N-acetyl-anhydromuramyl-L-alanine amidase AmpD
MKIQHLSAWLKSSRRAKPITGVILHSTAGASAASSISWLRRGDVMASYHYIIERDGMITKCVPTARQAWHAGKSTAWEGAGCNGYTVGIAFANRNDGVEIVTAAQENAAELLIRELMKHERGLRYISTHRLIAPGRKNDPRAWNFYRFAQRFENEMVPWRPAGLGWNG